jgi:hypothetical protein
MKTFLLVFTQMIEIMVESYQGDKKTECMAPAETQN